LQFNKWSQKQTTMGKVKSTRAALQIQIRCSPPSGPAADAGVVVHVPRAFLEAVAAQVAPARPVFRAEQSGLDLESEYQLLLQDGAFVSGAPRATTIAVELKLKLGHLPPPAGATHWAKSLVSRFAMQQYWKLHQVCPLLCCSWRRHCKRGGGHSVKEGVSRRRLSIG
jgi:hypothetical protein